MDEVRLKEAIQIVHEYGCIKSFADGNEGRLIDAFQKLINVAQSIIDCEGWPDKLLPEIRIATPLCEISFNKGRIVGHNAALDLCRAAAARDMLRLKEKLPSAEQLAEIVYEEHRDGGDEWKIAKENVHIYEHFMNIGEAIHDDLLRRMGI